MSIQPLIENAIKHGVSAVEGRGSVALRAVIEGEMPARRSVRQRSRLSARLCWRPSGHGLRNVAERLRGYYGDSARLCWECGPEGTRVALRIPRAASGGVDGEEQWRCAF